MVTILEKGEHNVNFHPMVDFIEASPLGYALIAKPTVYVSHIHQFWSTARIETTEEGTKILATVDDEPASPLLDVSQGEACPTDSGFIADQDRATIDKSSTLPYDSAPRVTLPVADEGSMQQTIPELMALCTSLQRKLSKLTAKFQAREVEINRLKERVKMLEDREGVAATRSGDDAPIKGRSMDEGEAATKRVSDDTKEMATVLTSMDAATVLASGVVDVPTGSGSIPTASTPAEGSVPTGSEEVPILVQSLSLPLWLHQLQEERAKRDAEIARIHAEEELQIMISGLDRNNETIAKYLEEYQQFSSELPMERRIERISDLGSAKKQKTLEEVTEEAQPLEEVLEENVKEMMQLVPIKEVNRPPSSDKEMELWVELNRMYEPDKEDQLWTYTQNFMHAPVDWKLYDSCGVHHVTSKDKEIFMLVEKDYPLRKGLALVMICYKLQVENFSHMANDLVLKIYKISNSPRQQGSIYPQQSGIKSQATINKGRRHAEDTDTRGRGYDKGQEAKQKQVKIMEDMRDKVQPDYHLETLMTHWFVLDCIMDSGASFHATYCKEELERFKLRSGKVRLADDKTLYIASIGDVVFKTSFGTSLTLNDVRIGMNMLASKGNVLDVRNVDIYFCKPGGLGKQKNLSFIMSEKTRKLQRLEQVHTEGYCPTFIASI
nr:retrovirus-related Pol polyprotein from transposon TNT 1-94 [Tanacetum cinerariifolium]